MIKNDLCLLKFKASHYCSRKFKGGICCGGHLAVTYGGELLYLPIFLQLSPPNKFAERELPFQRGLKSRTNIDYSAVNHMVTIMCTNHAE